MTPVSTAEAAAIERGIAALEARTGVQIVAAVVPHSDTYPELAWRAFALGTSFAALVALVIDVGRPDWWSAQGLLMQTLAILGGGGATGLVAARVPSFARLFLRSGRAKAEVRQYAEGVFLTREMSATPRRAAVLVMVSQFERRVVVVPDVAYRRRVTTPEWEAIVDQMTPKLRNGHTADAFAAGLAAIEALLVAKGFADAATSNALPDALVRGSAP